MLMIDKDDVRQMVALTKRKLAAADSKNECVAELQKLVDIKKSHMWRAEYGSCVGNLCNISSLVDMEITILQQTIEAVRGGDGRKASELLDSYLSFIDTHYDDERAPY